MNKLLVLTVLLLCLVSSLSAQVPERINYQGRLTDGASLINDSVEIVFGIYDQLTDGTRHYVETQTVAVADGLFSTQIGASNMVPGSLATVLTNEAIYLQVTVDGTPMTPREQMATVPYAGMAGTVKAGVISNIHLAVSSVTSDTIEDDAIVDEDISPSADIAGTKIQTATTSARGTVELAEHSERAASKAVQSDDPRLGTWTPISSIPYEIIQSGAYYVTTNLTSATSGITIRTNNVTLDLNGFTLTGGTGNGIRLQTPGSTTENILVQNGVITGFDPGINCMKARHSRFEQLRITQNHGKGVWLFDNTGMCIFRDCIVSSNSAAGIYVGGDSGSCNDNIIQDCFISHNAEGIHLQGLFGECNGNTIRDCTITENRQAGLVLGGDEGQCSGNTVRDCSVTKNGGYGIQLLAHFGTGVGNIIRDCTVWANTTVGISIYGSQAEGNRVEANHVSETIGTTTTGIMSYNSANNLIIRNTSTGQTNNYDLAATDTYGPIVTNTGALSATGDASHPLANFSR